MSSRTGLGFLLVSLTVLVGCPQDSREPVDRSEPSVPSVPSRWSLGSTLDQSGDLSGLTMVGERIVAVQNRPDPGQTAQIYELEEDGGTWSVSGRWSLVQAPGAWVDAEAITTTEAGTFLVLVESLGGDGRARIWEVELARGGEGTVPAVLRRQWRLPESYRERMGAGAEGMTRVPGPAGTSGADDATWVLVGHQARDRIGLFRLAPERADPSEPIRPIRELPIDVSDTSGMFWEGGSLFLWHNETYSTPRCRTAGAHVNVLERYEWTSSSVPDELRGSLDRWKDPQPGDGPCRNLEGIALSPCDGGVRTLYLVDDDGPPSPGLAYELSGLCP